MSIEKDKWAAELTKKIKLNGSQDGLGNHGVFDLAWYLTKCIEDALKEGKDWVEITDIIYRAIKYGKVGEGHV